MGVELPTVNVGTVREINAEKPWRSVITAFNTPEAAAAHREAGELAKEKRTRSLCMCTEESARSYRTYKLLTRK